MSGESSREWKESDGVVVEKKGREWKSDTRTRVYKPNIERGSRASQAAVKGKRADQVLPGGCRRKEGTSSHLVAE